MHQLGIQDGGPGGAANRVVAEHYELVIEHRAGAQTSHERRHAALALRVLARLRPVGFLHIDDWLRRRARQTALLRKGAKALERVENIRLARLRREFYRDGLGVTVDYRHPIAMRANPRRQRLDV